MHFHVFRLDLIGYHVWRQTETQTVVNNFYTEDANILNPRFNDNADTDRIMRLEFPVMQWLFAQSYRIFGSDVMISRILTFVIGLFSVFGMFFLLLNVFNNKVIATIDAWCFNFSPVFYYYTVNPLPDNMALCCAIWSIALFFKWMANQKFTVLIASAVFLCFATLCKLPFILYSSLIATYIILQLKNDFRANLKSSVLIISVFAVIISPAMAWYVWVIPSWGGHNVVYGMFDSDNSFMEIVDILQHNLISTLPELLINYGAFPFFLAGFYFMLKNKVVKNQYFPMFLVWSIFVLLYFIFEMNIIAKIHDYYLLPFLPILFLIVAYGAWNMLQSENSKLKYVTIFLLLLLPLTAYLRANPRWNTKSPGFNVDFYTYKTELRNLVGNDEKIIIGADESHFILHYYVDKKGWTFDENFHIEDFNKWINADAKYLFTDSQIDTISKVKIHLGEKIFEKGSIRVYKIVKSDELRVKSGE